MFIVLIELVKQYFRLLFVPVLNGGRWKSAINALLLEYDADLDRQTGYGATPLMLQTENNDLENVAFLLKHGADRTIATANGRTALDSARTRDNNSRGKYRAMIELLSRPTKIA